MASFLAGVLAGQESSEFQAPFNGMQPNEKSNQFFCGAAIPFRNVSNAYLHQLARISPTKSRRQRKKDLESKIVERALHRRGDNIAKRHRDCKTAAELSRQYLSAFHSGTSAQHQGDDDVVQLSERDAPWACYGCRTRTRQLHSEYIYSCVNCGRLFARMRTHSTPQHDKVCLVAARSTDRAEAVACRRHRHMHDALSESSSGRFRDRARCGPAAFALQVVRIATFVGPRLEVLINCAAQTIRPQHSSSSSNGNGNESTSSARNRYDDPAFVPADNTNSWCLLPWQVPVDEWREVFAINAIAPVVLVSGARHLFTHAGAVIINVHAREGLFDVSKSGAHVHTNMAKSALAMFTKCLGGVHQLGNVRVHGVDPGWISQDEYYADNKPWILPPLDEIDGAARILHPLFDALPSCARTRRHFALLTY